MKTFWIVAISVALTTLAINMFASLLAADWPRATYFLLSLWFLMWIMRFTD